MPHESVSNAPGPSGAVMAGESKVLASREDSPSDLNEAQRVASILQENPILYQKISDALACRREDVPLAVREVVRFLSLVASHSQGQLTPSRRVDLAWHEFLLCTRAYQRFCNIHFGRMIHHDPGGSAVQHREQFRMTLHCYRTQYGVPEITFWGGSQVAEAECGSCEAVLSRSTC